MSVISQLSQKMNQPANRSLTLLSVMLGATLTLTACGGDDHHEVMAVDKVDEASEIARANAPEAVKLESDTSTEQKVVEAADMTKDTSETSDTLADVATAEPSDEAAKVEEATAQDAAEPEAKEEPKTEAVAAAEQDSGLSADAGKQLYESNCKACHATGLLNSPKFGDKAAWKDRIPKGKEVLASHSAEGFNQMPAQAVNGVTVEQVQAAVDYMVDAAS